MVRGYEVLSLWYAPMGKKGLLDWTYNEVVLWTESDVKKAYPLASDEDVAEAMEIISLFIGDMDQGYESFSTTS